MLVLSVRFHVPLHPAEYVLNTGTLAENAAIRKRRQNHRSRFTSEPRFTSGSRYEVFIHKLSCGNQNDWLALIVWRWHQLLVPTGLLSSYMTWRKMKEIHRSSGIGHQLQSMDGDVACPCKCKRIGA